MTTLPKQTNLTSLESLHEAVDSVLDDPSEISVYVHENGVNKLIQEITYDSTRKAFYIIV